MESRKIKLFFVSCATFVLVYVLFNVACWWVKESAFENGFAAVVKGDPESVVLAKMGVPTQQIQRVIPGENDKSIENPDQQIDTVFVYQGHWRIVQVDYSVEFNKQRKVVYKHCGE
ncbi:MAG: hypothetical protein WCI73_01900 [Phycisphaerae bacterium]